MMAAGGVMVSAGMPRWIAFCSMLGWINANLWSVRFGRRPKMKVYRLYLLDANRGVGGAYWLNAEDDETAFWISERLCQACSDVCSGFELRHLARMVDGVGHPAVTGEAETARREQMLAQHLDIIRSSGLTVARSRKLAAAIDSAEPPAAPLA
jgi:hypothetical protein